MAETTATINVRLSPALKERGDSVLKEHGISTTQAIRALWGVMARTREIPDCVLKEYSEAQIDEKTYKKNVAHSLLGIVSRSSDVTDDDLNNMRLQGLIEKYEALV
ncbi:type II toxin-antitoxin system RelB/DinJ family antitoxin [Adlercreutzia sp. ZJ138]|uniref:type II toxin-antitoxin system RelB/DinJ family antitoxin n=1 Tax=Adlercreutzia sp. ZJ138 TaxID=2709405 RepID=UPI0013EAF47D|nr:type II toxin-antitoxin system RelB/DinJ family antitoxin [Adlercreutzia sp. ZJ138]